MNKLPETHKLFGHYSIDDDEIYNILSDKKTAIGREDPYIYFCEHMDCNDEPQREIIYGIAPPDDYTHDVYLCEDHYKRWLHIMNHNYLVL
jgi:hypothetical protein